MTSSRSDLLETLRTSHRAARPPLASAGSPAASRRSFRSLPAFQQMQVALAAANNLKLQSPYFRQVEVIDGTRVRIGGRWVTNFAAYDYLSLNRSPVVTDRVSDAVRTWGVSARASRLVGGDCAYHADLESALAGFLGTDAAVVTVSGHGTNQSILRTLTGPDDLIAVDALAHNSIFEGIRLSGAAHVTFPHNDWNWLDRHLSATRRRHERVLIVTEGLYSMDGDTPDLQRFVELKYRHDAWLMVDEAHSIGVLGATGRGISEASGVDIREIDILMGTLSKAFCSAGGFVAGSRDLVDLFRHAAPGFIYSVGLSAPNAAAALAALEQISAEPARVARLADLGKYFLQRAHQVGLKTGLAEGHAIIPVMVGDSILATRLSSDLLDQGFNVLPIITPAVPDKSARLRFFLNAAHRREDIDAVIDATAAGLAKRRAGAG